jgi:hypothetical protein
LSLGRSLQVARGSFLLAVSKPNTVICDSCQSACSCGTYLAIRWHWSPPLADRGTEFFCARPPRALRRPSGTPSPNAVVWQLRERGVPTAPSRQGNALGPGGNHLIVMTHVISRNRKNRKMCWGSKEWFRVSAKEYREFADECMGWAKTARSNQERQIFTQMALTWLWAASRPDGDTSFPFPGYAKPEQLASPNSSP